MVNRYQNISMTKTKLIGPSIYVNAIYPDIPVTDEDSYVITVLGDRLDLMALNVYGDTGYWVFIASANSLPGDSLYPPPGMQLRLPANMQAIVNQYNSVNKVR
jgi:hypothetical protein